MNQKGDAYVNILLFMAILVIGGLYYQDIESLIINNIQSSTTGGIGTDTYILILAAPILIFLYALYNLTKQPEGLTFG